MKKVLVIALALASVNAFASRARVQALGNSPQLVDTQTVYSNPADILVLGDYVNFESGTTTGGAENANAEGMITRSMGDSKLGLGLGHQYANASVWRLRGLSGVAGIVNQQNPVSLFYGVKTGDMLIGGSLVYSNYNDKQAGIKESSNGLRLGLRTGNWDAKLGLGLGNNFDGGADKFKGTLGVSGGVGYMMDDVYLSGAFELAGFKVENTTGAEKSNFDGSSLTVGALKSVKKDGNELFYGISLVSAKRKTSTTLPSVTESTTTTLALPLTVGMEVDAATWLTLRGSVTQSTLINSSKTESATSTSAETAPGANNTIAAIGAGLKFNKLTLDGSLQGLTGSTATQDLNGNKLLTTVGVTYLF